MMIALLHFRIFLSKGTLVQLGKLRKFYKRTTQFASAEVRMKWSRTTSRTTFAAFYCKELWLLVQVALSARARYAPILDSRVAKDMPVQPCEDQDADIFVKGKPMRLETVPEFFLAKNMASWGAPVIPKGQSWERLGDLLAERFGAHIWSPKHWEMANDPR